MSQVSLKVLLWIFIAFRDSSATDDTSDLCSLPAQPANQSDCKHIYFNWYYDPVAKECIEVTFSECDNDRKSFSSEEECYKHCGEKLIELHSPQNVTLAYIKDTMVYVYWYPPINYDLVNPNETNKNQSGDAAAVNETSKTDDSNQTKNQTAPSQVTNFTRTTTLSPSAANAASTKPASNASSTKPASIGTNTDTDSSEDSRSEPAKLQTGTQADAVKTSNQSTTSPSSAAQVASTTEELLQTNLRLSDFIGKKEVPFHLATLTHYIVSYKFGQEETFTNIIVPENITEKIVTGLHPETHYYLTVYAVYITNTSVGSPTLSFITSSNRSQAANCYCDRFGTVDGHRPCNLSLSEKPNCSCKKGYEGLFCEVCQHKYYRTAVGMPCHECPCSLNHSSGLCHFVERYLHCTQCKEGYAGNLCHRCANGYHRNSIKMQCEKCRGCSNIEPGLICDPFTGYCLQCVNSTGNNCETCREGYVGNKSNDVPCLRVQDSCRLAVDMGTGGEVGVLRYWYNADQARCEQFQYRGQGGNSNNFLSEESCLETCLGITRDGFKSSNYSPPSPGVIAAIVITIIVVLCAVIGYFVYRRSRTYSPGRPFWTVELKDDHEGVNFSALPEDEIERQRQEYERSHQSSSQPYSRLSEET